MLPQISALWLTVPRYTEDYLKTIGDPTLVILGGRDEMAASSDRLYRSIPGAELAIVPGAAHDAGEREVFWALGLDFLTRRT